MIGQILIRNFINFQRKSQRGGSGHDYIILLSGGGGGCVFITVDYRARGGKNC